MSGLTISQKIEKELVSKKADEIEELDLSDCKAESFEGLTDKLVNLKRLVAKGVGFTTTDGLPVLKNLSIVELANNPIKDLKGVAALPQLKVLDICNCGITDLSVLKPLYEHTSLESLNLDGNEVKNTEGFLETMFENLPVLCAVDGVNDRQASTFYEDYSKDYDSEGSGSDSDDGEIGLDALQQSGELEDDEDDFNPEDEDDEEDYDEEDDDEDEEADGEENHVEEKLGMKRKAETNGSSDTKHARVSGAAPNGDKVE